MVTAAGELVLGSPITFRVRELAGPGSKGPREVAPESAPALAHIAAYMKNHPGARVRIECTVNALKLSSGPNTGYGAHLAKLVVADLVARGVDCQRLEPAGVLTQDFGAPVEQVRALVQWKPVDGEVRADPCAQ